MRDETGWHDFIRMAIEKEASDIHLTAHQRPHMRCLGVLQPMDSRPLTEEFMSNLCSAILNDGQREKLTREREIDLSWTFDGRRPITSRAGLLWPSVCCRRGFLL